MQITYATVLGGLVGWQRREFSGKSAGPRTHALVCAASCLLTILSIHAFPGDNTGRVASQIIVGMGFIGAGMILHHADHVVGLTTAAGIWMTAAIGMTAGTGYIVVAAGTTLIMLLILMLDDRHIIIEKKSKPVKIAAIPKIPPTGTFK